VKIEPIGIIHTPYESKNECPIQPIYAAAAIGRVEVFEGYAAGLKDIEGFSHIYLLYHLDRAGEIELVRPTFLDDEPHGVFASRHPCRPNSIGMSIVRLIERDGNICFVWTDDGAENVEITDYH
jgi:tRNA-Thr(GGU) m(6)t(6)A37 methyltransferase TsaA